MMPRQFRQRRTAVALVLAACLIGGPATIRVRAAEPEAPWPAPVPGHVTPAPGEHPRLFFRVADLPRLRERAATAEGQAIVKRLRMLLDGGEGATLPKPPATVEKGKDDKEDEDEPTDIPPYGTAYTLWHGAGYGLLFQLTGEKRYADLGRAAVEIALQVNKTDCDPRYSFTKGTGALRNGPALSAVAMAYDLCYGGWDEAFRDRVRKEIEFYDPGKELGKAKKGNMRLEDLARGSKHGPLSNHWGPQIGGAAIALWAVRGDPGVDNERIDRLLAVNKQCQLRQLSEGLGDHGYFHEHLGPGQITTDTAFMPGLLAWKVAGGVDFVADRPEVPWCTLRFAMTLLPTPRGVDYLNPVRASTYGGQRFARDGIARGGQFCQGVGLVSPKDLPILRWTYEHLAEPATAVPPPYTGLKPGENSYDLFSRCPHRAIFSLMYWPIGIEPTNPATRLPRQVSDQRLQWHLFRNRWQDGDDILAGLLLGADDSDYFGNALRLRIWGLGRRYVADFPRSEAKAAVAPHGDDAWSAVWEDSCLAVDFAPGGGCQAVFLLRGPALGPDMPELQPGSPAAFDPTGEWRMIHGPILRCEMKDGKALLYDPARRELREQGDQLTLILGDRTLTGVVSEDKTTIVWKPRGSWNRNPPTPKLGEDEVPGFADITGEWKAGPSPDFPDGLVRIQRDGNRLTVPRNIEGELRWKDANITWTTLRGGSSRQGRISACGNLIDYNGAIEWRRVGSPAAQPAPWGGADDNRSRLTSGTLAGKPLTVLTFGEARHPAVTIEADGVRVGERRWRLEDGRLTPTSHQ